MPVEENITVFTCLRCGQCCKDFVSDSIKDMKINEFNSPITIYLHKSYLNLYDWEIENFSKELKNISSNKKILPTIVSFDLVTERTIVHMYTLEGQDCPFLKNNECSIYDKRPLVCRQFPCMQDMGFIFSNEPVNLSRNTLCKFEENDEFPANLDKKNLSRKELMQIFKRRYGDSFYYNMADRMFTEITAKLIIESNNKGNTKFAKEGYDLKFLLKRINNSQHIGISKWCEEQGLPLKSLYSIESVKEHFEKY
jgi:Fe-S-cluster containining protein